MLLRKQVIPYQILDRYVSRQAQVLDYGCGYGLVSHYLDNGQREMVAYDIDQQRLNFARKIYSSGQIRFTHHLGSITGQSYDLIILFDVLYLMPSVQKQELLLFLTRLLKPGGCLLLKETIKQRAFSYGFVLLEEYFLTLFKLTRGGRPRFFSHEECLEIINKAGLKAKEIIHSSSWLNIYEVFVCAR